MGTYPLQHLDDISRCHRPRTVDGQALTGIRIEHRQTLPPPPICRLVMDAILAPDMMGMRCLGWGGRARAHGAPFLLLLDDWQSLLLPPPASGLAIDTPAFSFQKMGNLAGPQARIRLREPRETREQLPRFRLA